MATTILRVTNNTTTFTPTTTRGAWDQTTGVVTKQLHTTPGGAATTIASTETSSTNPFRVELARFVSEPLAAAYSFTTSDTVKWILGVLQTASAVDKFHIHIFITQGDTDTLRGTILTDSIGATTWPTTATGTTDTAPTLTAVSASAGDRIVIEVGYNATDTVTTSFTGTMNYGNSGADLTNADTNVTTHAGNFTFTTGTGLTFANLISVSDTVTVTDKASTAEAKIIYGTAVGTGSSLSITGLGFSPDLVLIHKIDANAASSYDTMFKDTNMATGDSYPVRGDATNSTTDITSLDADGFTVGTSAFVNVNGITFGYLAFKNNPTGSSFWSPTYTGDGNDGLVIKGGPPEWAIEWMLSKSKSAITGAFKVTGTTDTQVWFGGADRTDLITSIGNGTFTVNNGSVNTANLVNVSATSHFGMAFKSISKRIKVGTYTGDGGSDKSINIGFQPQWVYVKHTGASSNNPTVIRADRMADGKSATNEGDVTLTAAVLRFNATGFEVGTDSGTNTNAEPYYYIAFQSDRLTISVSDSVTVTEFFDKAVPWSVKSDSVTVTENITLLPISSISVVDSIAVTENLSQVLISDISVSDSITVVDACVKYDDTVFVSEFVSLAVISPITTVNISVFDTITVSEFVNLTQVYTLLVSDSITVTESAVPFILTFGINIFDSVTISESVILLEISRISVFDTITITENVILGQVYTFIVFDSVTVSESVTLQEVSFVNVFDTITVSESVTMSLTDRIFVFDTVTVTENLAIAQVFTTLIFDTVTITENVSPLEISFINVSDSITVSEFVLLSPIDRISVFDTVTVSESISQTIAQNQSVFDTVTVTESATVRANISLVIFDSVTVTENATTLVLILVISKFDAVTVSENVTMSLDDRVSVSDLVTVGENTALSLISRISVTDLVTVGESITLLLINLLSVFDTITIAENIQFTFVFAMAVNEVITVSESVNLTFILLIGVYDLVTLIDKILDLTVQILWHGRTPITTPTFTDRSTISNSTWTDRTPTSDIWTNADRPIK